MLRRHKKFPTAIFSSIKLPALFANQASSITPLENACCRLLNSAWNSMSTPNASNAEIKD